MSTNTSSSSVERKARRPQSQLATDIAVATEPLRTLVAGLDPKNVPLTWAPEIWAALVDAERIAESGRLLMTGRAAEAGVWKRDGFGSAEEWLAAQQGTTTGRARADLETSDRLDGLDATADAVREGRLSPSRQALWPMRQL